MRVRIAAAALVLLSTPSWAQDAASHVQHHPAAATLEKMPAKDVTPDKMDMQMGMTVKHTKAD